MEKTSTECAHQIQIHPKKKIKHRKNKGVYLIFIFALKVNAIEHYFFLFSFLLLTWHELKIVEKSRIEVIGLKMPRSRFFQNGISHGIFYGIFF